MNLFRVLDPCISKIPIPRTKHLRPRSGLSTRYGNNRNASQPSHRQRDLRATTRSGMEIHQAPPSGPKRNRGIMGISRRRSQSTSSNPRSHQAISQHEYGHPMLKGPTSPCSASAYPSTSSGSTDAVLRLRFLVKRRIFCKLLCICSIVRVGI